MFKVDSTCYKSWSDFKVNMVFLLQSVFFLSLFLSHAFSLHLSLSLYFSLSLSTLSHSLYQTQSPFPDNVSLSINFPAKKITDYLNHVTNTDKTRFLSLLSLFFLYLFSLLNSTLSSILCKEHWNQTLVRIR